MSNTEGYTDVLTRGQFYVFYDKKNGKMGYSGSHNLKKDFVIVD